MKSEVYNLDCMAGMAEMSDKAFDLCFTDPPYNVGLQYDGYSDARTDYKEWCDAWFAEVERISHTVLLTPGMVNYFDWVIDRKRPVAVIPWVKLNQCSSSSLRGFNVWEPVLVYGRVKYQVPQDAIIEPIAMQSDAGFHACPKSLIVWQKLMSWFAKDGDSVIDPFLGSGTSRIAANNLGLDFTGYEISTSYFNAQEERFARHIAQPKLFAPTPTLEPQEALF